MYKKQLNKNIIIEMLNRNCSLREISEQLNCNRLTLKKRIEDYNIPFLANGRMEEKIHLTELQISVINGGLLGDACLYKSKTGNSNLIYSSNIQSHTKYFQSFLNEYATNRYRNKPKKEIIFDKRTHKHYTKYTFKTCNNITFSDLRNKWYSIDGKKIIPNNLKLNPITCLLWYLGDGSLANNYKKKETSYLKLSTNCFSTTELNKTIINQLYRFNPKLYYSNNQPIILIPRKNIKKFLDYIGPCPFKEYEYKWNIFPYKNKNIEKNGFNKFSDKEQSVINDFNNGISPYELSKKYKVEYSLIRYYLKKNKLSWTNERLKIKWKLISINGDINYLSSLMKFSLKNNLNHIMLRRTMTNNKFYKGWRCEKMEL